MRWKLLIGLSFAWLALGIAGLHVAERSDNSAWLWVVFGPGFIEYSLCQCVDRVFVDAAHGPPFLTISGVVLVYILPAVMLIWFGVYQLRPRLSAVVAALPLLLIGAGVFPWLYEPPGPAKGSVQQGEYLVEPPRPCAPGTPANTHRIFFKGRLVTRVAGEIVVSPINPSRLLFEAETWCTDEPVATFYFDGARAAPTKVFDDLYPAELSWSPDDQFLASSHGSVVAVNLRTGQSSDLEDFFVGKGVSDSHVEFRGWSPDGKTMDVANVASYSREDGVDFTATDLVSIDLTTLEDSYVGTIPEHGGAIYRRPEHERLIWEAASPSSRPSAAFQANRTKWSSTKPCFTTVRSCGSRGTRPSTCR